MQKLIVAAALSVIATAGIAAPARADDEAEIRALEAGWSEAFLKSDYSAIERIVAPEFVLFGVGDDGELAFIPRDKWMVNAKRITFREYETKVIAVTSAADTAVATIEGRWNVSMGPTASLNERFVLTDTLVRRNGEWQVLFRHSRSLPGSSPATPK